MESDRMLHDTGTCTCGLPSCAVCFLLRSPVADNQHSILSIPATPDPWDGAIFHPRDSPEISDLDHKSGPVMISLEEATRAVGVREVSLAAALDFGSSRGVRSLPFPSGQSKSPTMNESAYSKVNDRYIERSRSPPEKAVDVDAYRKRNQNYQSSTKPISPRLR